MNKKVLLSILTLGILFSLVGYGANSVLADDENPRTTIISRIAQKFNLKEEDVQAVFEAVRDERQAERQNRKEERLNQAVNDGMITEEQKNALLNKMQEQQQERGQNREEMRQWLADQGIDETKIRTYLGFGGHGLKGMGKPPTE